MNIAVKFDYQIKLEKLDFETITLKAILDLTKRVF